MLCFKQFRLLFISLGIPEDEQHGNKEKALRQYRLEAIHVKGFAKLQAEDIYDYFKEFNPVSFEWVDPASVNVLWAFANSAANALLSLSRPLVERSEDDHGMEVNERVAGEDQENGEDKEQMEKNKRLLSKADLMQRVI